MMNLTAQTEGRPEAMADVPGVCELPLTRAVVQYRDVHEIDAHGGRIQDIGLGLVLEGEYASAARVLDLGSAREKSLNLSSELVVLDWVYEPTLEHVEALLAASGEGEGPSATYADRTELARYAFDVALRVLERVGYGPLTRPTVLRIGYRDVCRDLDLHDGTAVRILMGESRVVRIHLDYDAVTLVARTGLSRPDPDLEEALEQAFSAGRLHRSVPGGGAASVVYQVRLPLPVTGDEARKLLRRVRFGLGHLLARFEPDRYRALEGLVDTFGARETLARLHLRDTVPTDLTVAPPAAAGAAVH